MRVTLLLCDAVHVIDHKLYVLGWGWTHTGPDPSPQAVAARIDVDPADFGRSHHVEVFLEDETGELVVLETADGNRQPVEVPSDFEVPAEADMPPGAGVSIPLALNFPPFPLQPDSAYTWKVTIDGETQPDWQVGFRTRPGPAAS